ncbi:hypothetical protein V6N13_004755 [Hibiscus sabdariffa]
MKPDHRPLLLSSSNSNPSSSSPTFKYFVGWSKHHDFKRMVTANWDSSRPLSDTIQSFTAAASSWNMEVFSSIGKNKKIIMAYLRGVQRCLDQRRTKGLLKLEQKLLTELETLLDHEEQLWKQKSRMDWIQFGDRNTKYFHVKAVTRHRRKKITMLKIDSDEWCDDQVRLREAASVFFATLFTVSTPSPEAFPISGLFPPLEDASYSTLSSTPNDNEIKDALFFISRIVSTGI